jgi:3-methylcrotonyl-CoA carboxylase alpha subunit
MFQKILIANRGEIACRVIATARKLGIRTVAVHSQADSSAKHVAMADEAVLIGPPAVSESYLRGERIIEAARRTGAEAIHPGYGFLSENPEFVEAVGAAGLVFIGPPAGAIRAMGLKDAAKTLMEKAGVPVVPGYHGAGQDPDVLAAEAERIGYPVLIKARAGGGGKGMRLVDHAGDFREALAAAQSEARSSFGDPACLIERYVTRPRHVEIQIFADRFGHVVHLFERDCSLQRRHQKVIEEAPAPGMSEEVREAMGRAAVEAARAIGYEGAGTVEFIADGSRGLRPDGFWFMEMNTRLQVEHPVTEAITGLDLVEWQLRVAAGEALPFLQQDLAVRGHAFEARVYAEDVPKGFLPATGTLTLLDFPRAAEFEVAPVRIDSGVRQGDTITPFYDPMIAKVIVHGPDRAAALNRLHGALAACHVAGSVTNLAFLCALTRHEGFARGEVDTGLIVRDLDALAGRREPPEVVTALAALATLGLLRAAVGHDPWSRLAGWRHWTEAEQFIRLEQEGRGFERRVITMGRGHFTVDGGEAPLSLSVKQDGEEAVMVSADGHTIRARLAQRGRVVSVFLDGGAFEYLAPDPLEDEAEDEAGGDAVFSPMPGLVARVLSEAGQRVERGQTLLVLEAMKMELAMPAPRDGTVAEILVRPGEQISEGALLLKLEPEAG